VRQVRLRTHGDFLGLSDPVDGAQYFPHDVFELDQNECFVDCGAFDGDTLEDFIGESKGKFSRIVAIEPDPKNYRTLRQKAESNHALRGRTATYCFALGEKRGTVRFNAGGSASSAISESGGMEVECITLDELLADESPTYIKMDSEGAELNALLGAREIIRRCRPKLAVCVYHCQNHLWEVPLLLKELQPDAKLYLKPHMRDGFDLVCYSIPL